MAAAWWIAAWHVSAKHSSIAIALFSFVGCGNAPPTAEDGGTFCVVDDDCNDGVACNGDETCGRTGLCEPGDSPCEGRCFETTSGPMCDSDCADLDGDGVQGAPCGTDCDDNDPSRNPNNVEICDTAGFDEDCDEATFGFRDVDGDGYPDAACCNGLNCGTDCDDTRPTVHPDEGESCNGVDDDCNGNVDEGLTPVTLYEDADGDGHGNAERSLLACTALSGYSTLDNDCDDEDASVNPGVGEVCDDIDHNCDGDPLLGAIEQDWYVDDDSDGHGDPTRPAVSSCPPIAGRVLTSDDCDDTVGSIHGGAAEFCDGIDTNCDGRLDGLGEDDDDDGYADVACGSGGVDCNDDDAAIYPGAAPELCDNVDTNCSGGRLEDDDMDGHAAIDAMCSGGPLARDDCNDDAASVAPTASESCNGTDDDCDGRVDEFASASCPGTAVCRAGSCEAPVQVELSTSAEQTMACVRYASGMVACRNGHDEAMGRFGESGFSTILNVTGVDDAIDLTVGNQFACVVRAGAEVACWGRGGSRQLNGQSTNDSATPVPVAGVLASRVVAGSRHGCALHSDGRVTCWGWERVRVITDGSDPLTGVTQLDAFGDQTCAIADGDIWCWYQEGPAATPTISSGDFVEVFVGHQHSCATKSSGQLYCWGSANDGRLGTGASSGFVDVPTLVPGLNGVTSVALGASHSCAVASGQTYCWGDGTTGQHGASSRELTPALLRNRDGSPFGPADELSASADATCARVGSSVTCWGAVFEGVPSRRVADLVGVTHLARSENHACALRGGQLWCWGGATNVTPFDSPWVREPMRIASSSNWAQLDMGPYRLGCVREIGGTVHCWGENEYGQLGRGTISWGSRFVREVEEITDAVDVSVGRRWACALRGGGGVWCWGRNFGGSLGRAGGDSSTPVVSGVSGASDIGAGGLCALVAGLPTCWGSGSATASVIPGTPTGATFVALSDQGTCGLLDDGRVGCWGSNLHGEAGAPLGTSPITSVQIVPGIEGATAVWSGPDYSCAVMKGRAHCWGHVPSGTSPGYVGPEPILVPGDASMVSFGASDCLAYEDGTVACPEGDHVDGLDHTAEPGVSWPHPISRAIDRAP